MSASLAVWAIGFYRSRISPLKGWHCARGQLTGHSTCSSVGLRAFRRAGWLKGYALLRRQFDRCAVAAAELSRKRHEKEGATQGEAAGTYLPLVRPGGSWTQNGLIDCGGCDGIDCPGCDLPDAPRALHCLDCGSGPGADRSSGSARAGSAQARIQERKDQRAGRRAAAAPSPDLKEHGGAEHDKG